MKLYIKNMVCNRCKMVVRNELIKAGLHPVYVELGEVAIEEELNSLQRKQVGKIMQLSGFVLIDNKQSRMIEKIKNTIVQLVHHSDEGSKVNLSTRISRSLNHNYNYLSNLFSEIEGITIEQYFITQRCERVKELLMYDELSLSEIAIQMNYSSLAHLSRQFKKFTGFTPTHYKLLKEKKRKAIDEL